MNIGDKVKEERLKKEWTQEQLAQLLNVSRSTVSSWEVGRNYPDLETVIAISDLFGISLDSLLREDKQVAKDTTKKLKRGKVYKIALIVVGILFLLYFGYNAKLRIDENIYRSNLEKNGWEKVVPNSSTQERGENNAYELVENGITYWTYVLPAELIGFPMPEQNISIITRQENFIVDLAYDNDIGVSISPENDSNVSKQFYVKVNQSGNLVESKPSWTEQEKQTIINYLSKNQEIHKDLINKSIEKRNEIIGKSD